MILLFLNQNLYCVYSTEPSQWDVSFEHQKYNIYILSSSEGSYESVHVHILV